MVAGPGDEADSSSRGLSCIRSPIRCFPVSSRGLSRLSLLKLLPHSVGGYSPVEWKLPDPLAAGTVAGDQAGSSEADWT